MGRLLEKAIAEAQRLPEDEQEAVGAWLLAEMEADRRWEELFSRPAPAIEQLADAALADHRAGRTKPLDPVRVHD
jgi:hypothetical protein